MCLFWTLCFVLTGGDVDDFARWSLGYWLNIWLVGSLLSGVFLGTLFYFLPRLKRFRTAA
jgi:hypothetical protein